MNEERDIWTDVITDAIIKTKFGDDVAKDKLQYYRDKGQKIHRNEMLLRELEK